MVVIKKRSNVIPVDFGEFKLEFPVSDSNIQRMKAVGEDLEAKAQQFKDSDDDKALETLKGLVEDGFNKTFNDKEAFDKVYLIEAIKGITEEFENQSSKEALEKYLAE